MPDRYGHVEALHLRVRKDLVDRQDRTARNARRVELGNPVLGRVLTRLGGDGIVECCAIDGTRLSRCKAGIAAQLGCFQHRAALLPHAFAARCNVDGVGRRRIETLRHNRRMIVPGRLRDLAGKQIL